jgi:hypothetical protein
MVTASFPASFPVFVPGRISLGGSGWGRILALARWAKSGAKAGHSMGKGGSMGMIPKAMRAGAAAAAAMLAVQPALAGPCALQDELMALNTRVLQSELVVAALNCKQSAQYNAFVTKFSPVLVASGTAFRNYFNRVYGPSGEQMMDEMVTRLANYAVMRSWYWGESYCPVEDAVFSSLMTIDPVELANFAGLRPTAGDHQVLPCVVTATVPMPDTQGPDAQATEAQGPDVQGTVVPAQAAVPGQAAPAQVGPAPAPAPAPVQAAPAQVGPAPAPVPAPVQVGPNPAPVALTPQTEPSGMTPQAGPAAGPAPATDLAPASGPEPAPANEAVPVPPPEALPDSVR